MRESRGGGAFDYVVPRSWGMGLVVVVVLSSRLDLCNHVSYRSQLRILYFRYM